MSPVTHISVRLTPELALGVERYRRHLERELSTPVTRTLAIQSALSAMLLLPPQNAQDGRREVSQDGRDEEDQTTFHPPGG